MKIKEIQERNYNATVRRGQINKYTEDLDFVNKLCDETEELLVSIEVGIADPKELADIVLVCLSFAKHKNIDLLKVMEEKMLFNETRED